MNAFKTNLESFVIKMNLNQNSVIQLEETCFRTLSKNLILPSALQHRQSPLELIGDTDYLFYDSLNRGLDIVFQYPEIKTSQKKIILNTVWNSYRFGAKL
jgi:hypothetical protein